jgi:excisionase family DNA binding protein
MTDEEYLNAVEAAAYLGLHRSRIYALADSGRLGKKLAGYWVFSKAELDAYKQTSLRQGGRPRKNK